MPKVVWTPEKVAQAKKLRAEGLTFTAIALRLRTSRSAVAGVFYRLNHKPRCVRYVRRQEYLAYFREPRLRIEYQGAGFKEDTLCALIAEGLILRLPTGWTRADCPDLPGIPKYQYVTKTSTTDGA